MLVDIEIYLNTVWHQEPPHINLSVSGSVLYEGILDSNRTFKYKDDIPKGDHKIILEFTNKKRTWHNGRSYYSIRKRR